MCVHRGKGVCHRMRRGDFFQITVISNTKLSWTGTQANRVILSPQCSKHRKELWSARAVWEAQRSSYMWEEPYGSNIRTWSLPGAASASSNYGSTVSGLCFPRALSLPSLSASTKLHRLALKTQSTPVSLESKLYLHQPLSALHQIKLIKEAT